MQQYSKGLNSKANKRRVYAFKKKKGKENDKKNGQTFFLLCVTRARLDEGSTKVSCSRVCVCVQWLLSSATILWQITRERERKREKTVVASLAPAEGSGGTVRPSAWDVEKLREREREREREQATC